MEFVEKFSLEIALVAVAFWVFVILITVTPIVLHFRKRNETEKTIRLAIEKGQQLDPETLERLIGEPSSDTGLTKTSARHNGIITAFVGLGLAAFDMFIGTWIMRAIGVMVFFIGAGIFLSAPWAKDDPKPRASDLPTDKG